MNKDDFRAISIIGGGKFAEVTKAKWNNNGIVAIRKLKLTEAAVVNSRKFQAEAKQLIKIVHENVVSCLGVILDERAFILEYCVQIVNDFGDLVPVHSLSGLISLLDTNIQYYTKIKVMYDVSSGLEYLHSLKVIAGDIKPSNILISEKWLFKVADFSVETAKRHDTTLISSTFNVSSSRELSYTLYYIPPELMLDTATNSCKNNKTDIFSFAVMLFETVFPAVDFRVHSTQLQHMNAVKKSWRPSFPDIEDKKYQPIVDIIENCWQNDPLLRLEAGDVKASAKELLKKVIILRLEISFFF